ncbi:MAG: TetR/AcrR family transcriptional regulator [Mollicutes bacterium]|nr:TetR/AcrR family transcriptional regulator [Mollicutes bacterium]MDY3210013.1 TetR/AcrR family transcriptional regulator [Candidatus Enterosoma sp.]MCI7788826.1 TetR/AcrR family transcriptional regulator [Mollicutes bacterium]MDD7036753.1 TetR/AcrR family transcriptional regulator [Mollicutes bacterium]MDY4642830.1 TetR/AcrR family transcriptional regulator [Candidatus Enterosoma sp.]
MTEEKEDGRIIRSKRDLANALIELLQEKNYDDIGIKEITDKARVSKNTFYNNFKDKNELLSFVFQRYEDALFEEIRPLRKKSRPIARFIFLRQTVKKITHFFCSRETLPFKKRIDNDHSRSIYYRLSLFILHLINRLDSEWNGTLYKGSDEEKQIKSTFYSGAFAALLYRFFQSGNNRDENKLVKTIMRLAAPARE